MPPRRRARPPSEPSPRPRRGRSRPRITRPPGNLRRGALPGVRKRRGEGTRVRANSSFTSRVAWRRHPEARDGRRDARRGTRRVREDAPERLARGRFVGVRLRRREANGLDGDPPRAARARRRPSPLARPNQAHRTPGRIRRPRPRREVEGAAGRVARVRVRRARRRKCGRRAGGHGCPRSPDKARRPPSTARSAKLKARRRAHRADGDRRAPPARGERGRTRPRTSRRPSRSAHLARARPNELLRHRSSATLVVGATRGFATTGQNGDRPRHQSTSPETPGVEASGGKKAAPSRPRPARHSPTRDARSPRPASTPPPARARGSSRVSTMTAQSQSGRSRAVIKTCICARSLEGDSRSTRPSKGGDGALAAISSTLAHDFDDADVDLSGICAWLEAGAADADPPAFAFDLDAGDARDAVSGPRDDDGATIASPSRRLHLRRTDVSPPRSLCLLLLHLRANLPRLRQGARAPRRRARDDAGDAAHFAESPKNGNDAARAAACFAAGDFARSPLPSLPGTPSRGSRAPSADAPRPLGSDAAVGEGGGVAAASTNASWPPSPCERGNPRATRASAGTARGGGVAARRETRGPDARAPRPPSSARTNLSRTRRSARTRRTPRSGRGSSFARRRRARSRSGWRRDPSAATARSPSARMRKMISRPRLPIRRLLLTSSFLPTREHQLGSDERRRGGACSASSEDTGGASTGRRQRFTNSRRPPRADAARFP